MNPAPFRSSFTRRRFLGTAAAVAAASALPRFNIARAGQSPNGRINVACVGTGNRGRNIVMELLKDPRVHIAAVADPDRGMVDALKERALALRKSSGLEDSSLRAAPVFSDYREMYARLSEKIDAVMVATPDHHHFPAAMMAVKRGKHVYVEKPLTHSVGEARALREAVKAKGVISQMGNQGRATEGIRLMKEWVEAGVIGDVREVVSWSPGFDPTYFIRPEALPLPAEAPPARLDWDLWCGPAEPMPYHSTIAPRRWRGWWRFGNGMLGDWACHTLDAPFWALELGAPSSVEAQVDAVNPEISPEWAEITWRFPARGARPPVTLKWLEGASRRPAPLAGWQDDAKKSGFPNRGMAMLGSRHTLFAPGGRPDSPRLLPSAVMDEFRKNRPPARFPRVVGGPVKEWLDAIAGAGPLHGSNFEYSVPLSEMVLLGVLAMRTGKRIEWDGKAGRVTNDPGLNRLVDISARSGWKA